MRKPPAIFGVAMRPMLQRARERHDKPLPQNGNEPGGDAAKNAANGAPQSSGQGKIPAKGGK